MRAVLRDRERAAEVFRMSKPAKIEVFDDHHQRLEEFSRDFADLGDACEEADIMIGQHAFATYALILDGQGNELDRVGRPMSTMSHFSPFSNATWHLLAFLSLGLDGKAAVTITASKNGLTLKLGKHVVGRGKDAHALHEDYLRHVARIKGELERLKS